MTKKLFRVKIIYDVMVAAEEDACSGWDNAYFATKEDLSFIVTGDDEPEIIVHEEITSVDQLGPEWDGAIPYCGDGKMTCNEILELNSESKKEEMIAGLSEEQKRSILSQMTLQEIVQLLKKPS